jgi:hypothetical protein
MTEQARALRAVRGLEVALRGAVDDSKLAYEFAANSYSFSAMNACMAAERALEVLRDALEESLWEREDDPAA